MVAELNTVRVSVRFHAPSLKVFTADKTRVNIVVGESNGAELLEIKVKDISVYGIQIRALSAPWV